MCNYQQFYCSRSSASPGQLTSAARLDVAASSYAPAGAAVHSIATDRGTRPALYHPPDFARPLPSVRLSPSPSSSSSRCFVPSSSSLLTFITVLVLPASVHPAATPTMAFIPPVAGAGGGGPRRSVGERRPVLPVCGQASQRVRGGGRVGRSAPSPPRMTAAKTSPAQAEAQDVDFLPAQKPTKHGALEL